jgi:hypothetical protein
MKKINFFTARFRALTIVLLTLLAAQSCSKPDEDEARQETSIIPAMYSNRPVRIAGTIYVSSKQVKFNVWDSQTVDGDIITLRVNNKNVLSSYSLVASKKSINVTLDNLGYNYVMLYAHNEGSLPPNTAALSITDSSGKTQNLILSANLTTNEAYNIVVE